MDNIVYVNVTDKMYQAAAKRNQENIDLFNRMGVDNTFRKDKPQQKINGYLGEMAVQDFYKFLKFSDDIKYDFVYNNVTFDVKTQGGNHRPKPHHVATLYTYNMNKKCDYYIFTSCMNDGETVYIAGFISQKDFKEKAVLREVGYVCSNFVYDQARYEIPYDQLNDPKTLASVLKISNSNQVNKNS
jgi:hypothetical protein